MKSTSKKQLHLLRPQFWQFFFGFLFGIVTVIGLMFFEAYVLYPKDYRFQLTAEPKTKVSDPKFSYKINIPNNYSADSGVFHFQDFGKFSGKFTDLTGWINATSGTNFDHQVKVVSVGRMYCEYCLDLLPYLNLMQQRYGDQVAVISVMYEKYPGELDEAKIEEYRKNHAFAFPIGLDKEKKFIKAFDAELVPTTLVIDKNNTIIFRQVGLGNFDQIGEVLQHVKERDSSSESKQ